MLRNSRALLACAVLVPFAVFPALSPSQGHAQTYRTYPGLNGGSTTYGSDGSTARSYPGLNGSETTYITGPNGERTTCRAYQTIGGGRSVSCR